jgi:ubiquinone/menaquinone biosynthesis C-methylase UbiE
VSRIEPPRGPLGRLRRQIKKLFTGGPGRERRQGPDRVVAALALEPGQRVADIGAGAGFFAFRLARAVSPGGRVYAIDTDLDVLSFVQEEADESGMEVVPLLAGEAEPGLPEPVDLHFLSASYHHLPDVSSYMAEARRHLRPGGRVAVIEDRHDTLMSRLFGHASDPAVVKREMAQAGYHLLAEHDFIRGQLFLVFGLPEERDRA